MININFSTGLEEININEKHTIYFNARDFSLPEKITKFMNFVDKSGEELKNAKEANEMFAKLNELGEKINNMLDGIFGKDASKIFEGVNPLTFTFDNDGNPTGTLISNFLNSIMPYIKEKMETLKNLEEAKSNEYLNAAAELNENSSDGIE